MSKRQESHEDRPRSIRWCAPRRAPPAGGGGAGGPGGTGDAPGGDAFAGDPAGAAGRFRLITQLALLAAVVLIGWFIYLGVNRLADHGN